MLYKPQCFHSILFVLKVHSGSLICHVTHDDFNSLILPALQKALLRNPEVVLESEYYKANVNLSVIIVILMDYEIAVDVIVTAAEKLETSFDLVTCLPYLFFKQWTPRRNDTWWCTNSNNKRFHVMLHN